MVFVGFIEYYRNRCVNAYMYTVEGKLSFDLFVHALHVTFFKEH